MHGALVSLVAALLTAGCGALPSLENRSTSKAFTDTENTRLGKAVTIHGRDYRGLTGIYPLLHARDAFAARVLLARAAERSLDVQYYIWRNDTTGTLLFKELCSAADRGVRVRLLLDDNNTSGLDATLAALDAHPNIEVRLFNPFVMRSARIVGYLTDFSRLNHRMHNKSFTADNQVAIIGGRNVGDEYFGATQDVLFVDLDVMAVGTVVNEVSNDFDRYWASGSSYPVDRLLARADPERVAHYASTAALIERSPEATAYVSAVRDSPFVKDMLEGRLPFEWAATRMLSDDPAKALPQAQPRNLVFRELTEVFGDPATELDLVSAYFVPTAAGVDALVPMARRGVNVRVLTNSLEATDVAPVHAGYAKRRKALLAGGVKLYEMRLLPGVEHERSMGSFGSSGSSLHAKTFSADRSRIFIGSYNFDPRSARLNTELGFIIESPTLANSLAERFEKEIPASAYEVHLTGNGELYWTARRDGKEVRYDTEPGTSFWLRTAVWVMSLLPIEWLL
jgi:putative cardiolipin synthase